MNFRRVGTAAGKGERLRCAYGAWAGRGSELPSKGGSSSDSRSTINRLQPPLVRSRTLEAAISESGGAATPVTPRLHVQPFLRCVLSCIILGMKVLPDLRNAMDINAVTTAELRSSHRLLPPRWSDRALQGSESVVGGWFESLTRREYKADASEYLLARKLGRGSRPCELLGLKERLLYRGAVSILESTTVIEDRSQEAHRTFLHAPLAVPDTQYVLKADIASYYDFVDHERLVDEVVAQTGDDLVISLACEVLSNASGRRFGLPQLSDPSDHLAGIYIGPMQRSLVRSGHISFRFVDDFRVASPSYASVLSALEVAEEAARELGLVLNEMKTSTPGIAVYRKSLDQVAEREQAIFAELEIEELQGADPFSYGDIDFEELPDAMAERSLVPGSDAGDLESEQADMEPEAIAPSQLLAARRVLLRWLEEEEDDETQRAEFAQITAKLVARALRVATISADTLAFPFLPQIIVYEPSLTPAVCHYLRACALNHRKEVVLVLNDICRSGIVSAWQALWICYAAGSIPRRPQLRGAREPEFVAWLRTIFLNHRKPALRAEAALALATHRKVSAAELKDALETVGPLHRPTIFIALAVLDQEAVGMQLAGSEIERLYASWRRFP